MASCKVLLGISGSVAALKGPELAARIAEEMDAEVKILLTRGAENFWNKAETYNFEHWAQMRKLQEEYIKGTQTRRITLIYAEDEWSSWNTLGDPVLHIDLRNWADILVLAPLSAHTLAKLASGLCDDTLSCVVRAWDFGHGQRQGKPLVLAPAMNTAMWEHPITRTQLETLVGFWNAKKRSTGVEIVEPQAKMLACGEEGKGALASVSEILASLQRSLPHTGRGSPS